jgi:hypothetical protein
MQRFILAVEGPNLNDLDEVELHAAPSEGDPIETRFGTCVVTATEELPGNATYAGRIIAKLT